MLAIGMSAMTQGVYGGHDVTDSNDKLNTYGEMISIKQTINQTKNIKKCDTNVIYKKSFSN